MRIFLLAALALAWLGPQAGAAQPRGCPPGLAKKDPPCVPPGLARNDDWRDSEEDWSRYRLPPLDEGEAWYRDGRIVYRIDERTRRVIDWIRLTDEILNE